MLIKDIAKEYLASKMITRETAYKAYKPWVRIFVDFLGDDKEFDSICYEDVGDFKIALEKGVISPTKTKYSRKSVEFCMTILAGMLQFGIDNGHACGILPKHIRPKHVKASSHRPITTDQYLGLINHAKSTRDILLIRMLFETALRVGELADLRVDDLQPGKAIIKTEKTEQLRTVFWGEVTEKMLSQYVAVHKPKDKLFEMTSRSIQRNIKKICKKAGIDGIVPHSFRHGWAVLARERGMSLSLIQNYLGHKNASSTLATYQQYSDAKFKEDAHKIIELINEEVYSTAIDKAVRKVA